MKIYEAVDEGISNQQIIFEEKSTVDKRRFKHDKNAEIWKSTHKETSEVMYLVTGPAMSGVNGWDDYLEALERYVEAAKMVRHFNKKHGKVA